jgi:hypothetical protein
MTKPRLLLADDHRFGANVTYNLTVDLMRAGILPGALLQVRAESRYGPSAITNTGQIVPNNTIALSPTNYSDPTAGYEIAVTQLSYVQFLSERVGLIIGKLDLYGDGDLKSSPADAVAPSLRTGA